VVDVYSNHSLPSRRAPGPPGTIRIGAAGRWFPEFIYEVVAHRVGDYWSITLVSTGPRKPQAWIEHFRCSDPDQCVAQIRDWLIERALEVGGMDDRILDWACRVSERIALPSEAVQ
jgi:hypothetical protein